MNKSEIEGLISILETKLKESNEAIECFIISQEIQSLKQQLKGVN